MQQKTSSRDKIVAAARQLFSERGFHRTAMADLAESAQISVGAIYRAFSGKLDIIRAIIRADTEEMLLELQADVDQVRGGHIPAEAALEGMITTWVSQHDDPLKHEIVAEGHRDPEVAAMISGVCSQFREIFRTLARLIEPTATQTEIEGTAELLIACLFGLNNREFTQPLLSPPQTAAVLTQLIVRALQCPDEQAGSVERAD